MTKLIARLHSAHASRDRGETAVELGLIGAVVAVAGVAVVTLFGGSIAVNLRWLFA